MTDEDNSLPVEEHAPETLHDEEEAERVAETVLEEQRSAAEAAKALSMDLPEPSHGGMPPGYKLPPNFKFPRGKTVLFLQFPSTWTDAPWKGDPMPDPANPGFNYQEPVPGAEPGDDGGIPMRDMNFRQCIVWPVNTPDKRLALQRAQRDPNRAPDELAKQMIRVHDGTEADWGKVSDDGVEMFWNEIGEKCRGLVTRVFSRLHVLNADETSDFLRRFITSRSTGS